MNGGTTATLQGLSVKSGTVTSDAYRYFVPNGTLVVDNSGGLTNNTTGTNALTMSLFILGAATNIVGTGFSAPSGFLIATNNAYNCAVYLGDANYPNGGLTLGATVTNYVSDGDVGITNSGTMTIGGQNTSGINTYANPIILGWTPNRGKSVTLLAAPGGQVDFTGNILRNGTDTTAGITVGDDTHTGTIKLAGANTYVGPTIVKAGKLLLTGSVAGNVTVTGGILAGNGTITGPVTIQPGATLAPTGTLTISNHLTLAAASTLAYDLGASNDLIAVTGNLTLAGTLNITDAGGFTTGTYTLFTYTGSLTNNGLAVGTTPDSSLVYTLDTNTTGQVKLLVSYTPWVAWQMAKFGFTNGIAAPTANPTGDGLANLMKYALGLDPLTACANPLQFDHAATNGFTYLRLSTPRDPAATNVLIEGLSAGTLLDTNAWSTTTTVIESNTPSFFRVRDALPIETNGQRFLKLRFRLL